MMVDADPMSGGLPEEADWMLAEAPAPPFDWVREGASFWVFEEGGAFAIPRIGVEAEPHSWDNRRYHANFAFADGRVLQDAGRGAMPPVLDDRGRRAVLGGGPLVFRCIEPFRRWHVAFDGSCSETHVSRQIAGEISGGRRVPLRYEFEATMVAPADVQDVNPGAFFTWGKGKQRDAASVGLGWRFQQLFRVEGELEVDGASRSFRGTGNRVKRRSVRTDGLFLRGHCWMSAAFPDGRAFGFEVRPVHADGHEPWNEAFVYLDGRMHHGRVTRVPWLDAIVPEGEDVSIEIETDLGTTRIAGTTLLSTFRIGNKDIWGLDLHQGGVRFTWDDQVALGMIERSTVRS